MELCEVGSILAAAGAHAQLNEAASRLPDTCRWRDVLMLIAGKRYVEGAALYAQIGSQPLAADAHLLAARQAADQGRTADAHRHAEAVFTFAERTGASLYRQRAEVFVGGKRLTASQPGPSETSPGRSDSRCASIEPLAAIVTRFDRLWEGLSTPNHSGSAMITALCPEADPTRWRPLDDPHALPTGRGARSSPQSPLVRVESAPMNSP